MLKSIETKLPESTAEVIEKLAGETRTDTSAMLVRLIENGLRMELLKRSVRLYAEGKVSMWKAAQLAGVSFYEMMVEIKKHGVPIQYGVEDFEADLKTIKALESSI